MRRITDDEFVKIGQAIHKDVNDFNQSIMKKYVLNLPTGMEPQIVAAIAGSLIAQGAAVSHMTLMERDDREHMIAMAVYTGEVEYLFFRKKITEKELHDLMQAWIANHPQPAKED